MTRNYEEKLSGEIISRNYQQKLLQEIIRRNYHTKLSASILCLGKRGNYRDTGVSKKYSFFNLMLYKMLKVLAKKGQNNIV